MNNPEQKSGFGVMEAPREARAAFLGEVFKIARKNLHENSDIDYPKMRMVESLVIAANVELEKSIAEEKRLGFEEALKAEIKEFQVRTFSRVSIQALRDLVAIAKAESAAREKRNQDDLSKGWVSISSIRSRMSQRVYVAKLAQSLHMSQESILLNVIASHVQHDLVLRHGSKLAISEKGRAQLPKMISSALASSGMAVKALPDHLKDD